MAGFIKLYRGWRECDAFEGETFSEREAWLWLLENAAWKDGQRRTGKGNIVDVKRGQLHTAERTLATIWKWDRKRVGRFLKKLEKCAMIGPTMGPTGTLITICNYEKYQGDGANHGANDRDNNGANHGATQEEGKEIKKEEPSGDGPSYAFFGKTIKLNAGDLERWRNRYHAIPDMGAELGALDDWLQGQTEAKRKGWFQIVSGALNRKHQECLQPEISPVKTVVRESEHERLQRERQEWLRKQYGVSA